MKVKIAILVMMIVAGVAATSMYRYATSDGAQRDELLKEFLLVLPDRYQDYHKEEITGLLVRFWYRFDTGKVEAADYEEVMASLDDYVTLGEINQEDLNYLMAQVGYYTFKTESRYNLPDGEIDHPTLNPEGAMVTLGYDSTFWVEFEAWKALEDSLAKAEKNKNR
jgi:hypothetical protein